MQAVDRLRSLVSDVRDELAVVGSSVPLLIKIGPDLDDQDLTAIVVLALEVGLDGIVAVNTTVDRTSLTASGRNHCTFDGGGVSGAPLRTKAVEVLRRIRAIVGDGLVLISVGGVESSD